MALMLLPWGYLGNFEFSDASRTVTTITIPDGDTLDLATPVIVEFFVT